MPGIVPTAIAIIVLSIPTPRAAEIMIVKSIDGIAWITSRSLIMTVSAAPPKYPAIAPTTVPIAVENNTAAILILKEYLPP